MRGDWREYSHAKAEPAAKETRRSSVPRSVPTPVQKIANTK
jgi:hypothetical protein